MIISRARRFLNRLMSFASDEEFASRETLAEHARARSVWLQTTRSISTVPVFDNLGVAKSIPSQLLVHGDRIMTPPDLWLVRGYCEESCEGADRDSIVQDTPAAVQFQQVLGQNRRPENLFDRQARMVNAAAAWLLAASLLLSGAFSVWGAITIAMHNAAEEEPPHRSASAFKPPRAEPHRGGPAPPPAHNLPHSRAPQGGLQRLHRRLHRGRQRPRAAEPRARRAAALECTMAALATVGRPFPYPAHDPQPRPTVAQLLGPARAGWARFSPTRARCCGASCAAGAAGKGKAGADGFPMLSADSLGTGNDAGAGLRGVRRVRVRRKPALGALPAAPVAPCPGPVRGAGRRPALPVPRPRRKLRQRNGSRPSRAPAPRAPHHAPRAAAGRARVSGMLGARSSWSVVRGRGARAVTAGGAGDRCSASPT